MTAGRPRSGDRSIALAHDYLLVMRGAERTFLEMARCWPDAPITTLLYDESGTEGLFADHAITTSFLNRLGLGQRQFRKLLPLFPPAARSLRVEAPVLVSSSSAFAHAIRAPGYHVCYCHTPFRYAWVEEDRALAEVAAVARPILSRLLRRFRAWDRKVSADVTAYIANSRMTQERIAACWGREATVIHPPVEVARFRAAEPEDFFLAVGELVPHKRIDVALEASVRAGAEMRVVGTGPDEGRLRDAYEGRGITFLGRVGDRELADLYSRCLALVVPNVEEFGIAAVEAQASGRPVLALGAGGARETVIEGETGVLVDGSVDQFAEAIRHAAWSRFSPQACIASAARFTPATFREQLVAEVERVTGETGG